MLKQIPEELVRIAAALSALGQPREMMAWIGLNGLVCGGLGRA